MAEIFLSYAKEDRVAARRIAKVLESCGWSVFWDRNIEAGDNWRQVVQSELDAAGAVVVLWSATSVDSTWVVEEAERGRRRLVSVLITSVPLPIGFGTAQAIDLIDWTGGRSDGITALMDATAKTLQRPPQQPPRVPASVGQKRGMAAAAGLLVIAAAGALLYSGLSAPPPLTSQEILLDTSEGMKSNYDASTPRLSVAVEQLGEIFFPEQDNLALRAIGGPCEGGGELVVPFGTNRRNRLSDASKQLQAAGRTTLVSAVIAALTDVQRLPNQRRIVVITGHADQCDVKEPIRELKRRVAELPATPGQDQVALEFRFIGFGVPPEDAPRIQEISQAVGGDAYFVTSAAELHKVLQLVLEFEPAVGHVKNVWNIVDEVGKSMTGVAQNMNAGSVREATSILDAGADQYAQMRRSFDSLKGVQSVTFARFYKLASENRVLQEQAFATGRAWIRGGAVPKDRQSSGYEASVTQWNERVAKWNEIVAKYNANINEMNRLTDEIVKETRRRG